MEFMSNSFLNEKNLPEKDELLAVLYNNAGTVTINLPKNATNDKRLMKAVELCNEPYLRFVIALNLTGRVKALASVKEYGVMISRSKEIIKREEQVQNSPDFVLFSAVKFVATGYMLTGQGEEAVEVLNEYIPLIPDESRYNLIKASLLSFRGQCYDSLGEYEKAINDFKNSIILAGQTVDDNSRQLATTYVRLGVGYGRTEEWELGLYYFEKAITGYKYATAYDKGILYWNAGIACSELNQLENAKKYFLKAYINNQMLIDDLGDKAGDSYGIEVKEILYQYYLMEKNFSLSFSKWLAKESQQYKSEEEKYLRETDLLIDTEE